MSVEVKTEQDMQTSRAGGFSRTSLLFALALSLLAGLTYVRGLTNGFVAEDFIFLPNQPFGAMWSTMMASPRIRPIALPFDWVAFRLFGTNPFGYHLLILALHVVITLLLFRVAGLLSGDERIGFAAALVFTVYPRHHQTVMWWAANPFVLTALFSLLCVYAFEKYLRTRQLVWQALALLTLGAAIMSYEAGVVLFALLPLLELTLHVTDRNIKSLLSFRFYGKYLPYVALMVVYLLINFGGNRLLKLNPHPTETDLASPGLAGESYHLSLGAKTVKDALAYLTYSIYPHIPLRSLDPNVWTALLAIGTCALLFMSFLRGTRLIRFSILWVLLALAPVVLFVPFGNADRYFYLPALGFSMLLSALGWRGYDKLAARSLGWARAAGGGLLAVYLVSSVFLLWQRAGEWRRAGEIAADVVQQTMRLHPHPSPGSTLLYVNLPTEYGQAYIFLGPGVSRALALADPDWASVEVYDTRDPEVIAFLEKDEPEEAPLQNIVVLLYQNSTLVDKSGSVGDVITLKKETWYRR